MYHGALKDEALKIHEEALREYNDQCEKMEEWKNWKPDWAKDEVSADTANASLTEGNASVALSDTAAVIKSFKSPSQSAEESVSRVMGWIAAHHGFDKIAVYEVEDYFIILCTQQTDFLICYPIRLAKRSPLPVV